jgi:diguanylate cyclase (GGDEF)-like protein
MDGAVAPGLNWFGVTPSTITKALSGHARLVSLGAAVLALGLLSVELAPAGSTVAAWWPAAGVSAAIVAAHFGERRRLLLMIVLASGAANLVGGRPVAVALGFAISNAAEAWVVGAWLNRNRRGAPPVLRRMSDIWELVFATALGALTIAIGAALTVQIIGDGSAMATFRTVIPSHATAVLVLTPFVLAAPPAVRRSVVERTASWAVTAAVVVIVFWPDQTLPLAFVPTAALMWTAVRLGLRATAAQLVMAAITVTILSANGGSLMSVSGGLSEAETNIVVQAFILTNALVLLPLATGLAERESALVRAQASEILYRTGFSEAIVGMMLIRLEPGLTRVVQVNDSARDLLRLSTDERLPNVLSDERGRSIRAVADGLAHGQGWAGEMRIGDDRTRWFNVAVTKLSRIESAPPVASVQFTETTDFHRIQSELEHLALCDSLTGLPNRTALIEQLDGVLAGTDGIDRRVAVMFFDLDDFKVVNDAYGHLVGDRVLRELAGRFRSAIRPGDTLARVGGDEFVLMCPNVDSIELAMEVARRVLDAITEPVSIDDLRYEVNLSGGLTISTTRSTSEQMLKEADVALYAAKAQGKRHVAEYTRRLGEEAADRVRIESELRTALRESEFEMHMQPVIDLDSGEIEAAEALIRWNHPIDGLRPPAVWLDIAERAGLMPELGAWALDRSVAQAREWIDLVGLELAPLVHVNVSARQLDQPGLASIVVETLARHDFPAGKLVLELTETFLARVRPELVAELETLDRIGVRIAADDFGTGFSPLTRVLELPISMIKIDRQFIASAAVDERAYGIVDTLVKLAAALRIDVVAEGVETPDQLDVLRRLGCHSAQGYLWSRPVPGGEFAAALAALQATRLTNSTTASLKASFLSPATM